MARVLKSSSMFKLFNNSKLIYNNSNCGISTSNTALAVASKGGGANPIGRKRFRRQPKSTDAEYLVSHVSGSCYFETGEDVKIKDDSQYPDWIWKLDLGKPKQPSELEFGTKEYWEAVKYSNTIKFKRMLSLLPKPDRIVDKRILEELEWKKRIQFRALASDDVDPGLNPDDYRQRPDRKMFLRPNKALEEEEFYPDEFVAKNPDRLLKSTRKHDPFIGLAPKTRFSKRKSSGYFPDPTIINVHPESFLAKLPNIKELVSTATKRVPFTQELPDKGNSDKNNK